MLYVCDTTFQIGANDLLAVDNDGPLSTGKIDETINGMALNIAGAMGYTKCTPFGTDNYTMLDALYEEDKSVAIPLFMENFNAKNDETLKSLTPANVSFVVLTSVSGNIDKPPGNDNYCSVDSDGYFYETLAEERLVNFRYYRYARDDKFDCYPICSDIYSSCYYIHNKDDEVTDCAVMLKGTAFCLGSQLVVGSEKSMFLPIDYFPISNYYTFYTTEAHPLGEDFIGVENASEYFSFWLNEFNSNYTGYPLGGHYFRNFSKFYVFSNKEI